MCEFDNWNCALVIDFALIFEIFVKLTVFLAVLLTSISLHEAAHAWVSHKFGDDTAYLLGRVSLDPRKHVHPIGTFLIPIAAFIVGNLGLRIPVIGWGRPTPVNGLKWSNLKWGNFCVSIAGVTANLILVGIGIIAAKLLMMQGIAPSQFFDDTSRLVQSSGQFMWTGLFVLIAGQLMWQNISLFIFNLLPVPPLDGGHILEGFLPDSFRPALKIVEKFGFIILLFLIWFNFFGALLRFFLYILNSILGFI